MNDLYKLLTTGAMLKIIAGAIKPIHDKIAELDRRIQQIEQSQRATTETVNNAENASKSAEKKLAVTESNIRILEEKNAKLKKVVVKQQSQIAYQEKKARLRNVVIGGVDEIEPLSVNEHTASSDEEKVKLILISLNMSNVDFVSCRRTGTKDYGPQKHPRFLIVEFSKRSDRNAVKASGP